MERQLWKQIVVVIRQISKDSFNPQCRFQAEVIVKVWFWAVIHDRPVSWACDKANWMSWDRFPKPSETTMSRRLRSDDVINSIQRLGERVCRSGADGHIVWMIDGKPPGGTPAIKAGLPRGHDGKPLVISGCSSDRQAGYGRATGGKAKGDKLHVIVGSNGTLAEWHVAPMNVDERKMAQRMLKAAALCGYVIGDGNYDVGLPFSTDC